MAPEPIYDVAHLGHVELYTDKFEESLDFFTRVYGLTESGRDATSAYLRAFDDYEFHTLKLTARAHHRGWPRRLPRASPAALERRVAAIETTGMRHRLDRRRSRARPRIPVRATRRPCLRVVLRYRQVYEPPPERAPALKNIAQRYHGRGCCPRRLDHVNLLAERCVGVPRLHGHMRSAAASPRQIHLDNGRLGGCWFTVNNKSYDLACTEDHAGRAGPAPPCDLRCRPARGHPARGRHLPGERRASSRPVRTSMRSRGRSSFTSGSRPATASNSPMPARG